MNEKIKLFSKSIQLYVYFVLLFIPINLHLIQGYIFSTQKISSVLRDFEPLQWIFYLSSLLIIAYLIALYDFNFKFFVKIPIVYLMYAVISYLFSIAINLNNPEFHGEKLLENSFFQDRFFPTILLLVILIALFRIISVKTRWFQRFPKVTFPKNFDNLFLSQFIISLYLSDDKFLAILPNTLYLRNISDRIEGASFTELHYWIVLGIIIYLSIIGNIIGYLAVQGMRDFIHNRSSVALALISSICFAAIFDLIIQMSLGTGGPYVETFIFPGAISFQFFVLFFLYLLLYFFVNRYLAATIILVAISSVFSVANSMKITLRGEPILPSDLVWIFKPEILFGFVNLDAVAYTSILAIFVIVLLYYIRKKFFINPIVYNWKFRVGIICLLCLPFVLTNTILKQKEDNKISDNIPILSTLQNSEYIAWLGNLNHARYKSLAYIWANQLSTPVMEIPEGYSADSIKQLEEKYSKIMEMINANREESLADQTVIYILSESFSDPTRLAGVSISENPIPYINDLKNKYTSGLMKSNGYGGGTANMEFQTLTGIPFYNISPSVSVLYTEVVPKMTKVPSISDVYVSSNRYAIHLASGANYSRKSIYNNLKFNKFINTDDKDVTFERQGLQPSDRSTYQYIVKNLNSEKGQFFSVMTMQNHGVWSEDNPSELVGTGEGFEEQNNMWLTSYARLMRYTDNATKDFLDQLSKINKKITVVFYGDHLPGLYPESVFESNPESQYLTDYFVWSNYETPKLNYSLVNSSDFSALVLEQTNSKVSPYYALLTEVLHKASVDKKPEDLDQDAKQVAEDLKLVEYDLVRGKGYLSDDFFKMPK